ncbi:DNA cytosine methyltransferase [Roseibium alexandrii]
MRYGSVCSGIEAATQAWHPLGWSPVFFSEIDRFPSAVLAHHYGSNLPGEALPENGVPNLGDMSKFREWPDHAIDLLVGGTPCQSFSVAGLRKGLDDPRGNLMLTYLAIARRYQPRWLVWENVPGALSSWSGDEPPDDLAAGDEWTGTESNDFGTFLTGLSELGYHAAWRVLDAQCVRVDGFWRAVPQRRRRLFVIGYLGDWRRAAAVLFERESLQGHPAPRRQTGQGTAPTLSARTSGGGGLGTDFDLDGGLVPDVANPLTARMHKGINTTGDEGQTMVCQGVAHSLKGEGCDASEDGTGRGTPIVPVQFDCKGSEVQVETGGVSQPLRSMGHLDSHQNTGSHAAVATHLAVRRLTPRECERLQGFPDDYTAIPWRGKRASSCPDTPRYKALGNSMAVNVMRWIGRRIEMVEELAREDNDT